MDQKINGCVQLEKQGNHVSVISEDFGADEVLSVMIFSLVSIAKSEGIDLERIYQMLDTLDKYLDLEECEQKNE